MATKAATGRHPLLGRLWLKPIGWVIGHVLMPIIWRFDVIGRENVPATGSFIIAANHMAGIDGPFVLGQSPRWFRFIAKKELFAMGGGILGVLLRGLGLIAVDRDSGRAALAASLEALRHGEPVGLFPEGNRGRGDVGEVRAGVAWLAINSGVPVVPVACLGTRLTGRGKSSMPGFRQRIVIAFAPPVTFERAPGQSTSAAIGDAITRFREILSEHVTTTSQLSGIPLPADDGRTTEDNA